MTQEQDEIIRMAWDSGAYTHRLTTWGFSLENLERFTSAVAAKAVVDEREACAKVAEHKFGVIGSTIALAIKARGEQA